MLSAQTARLFSDRKSVNVYCLLVTVPNRRTRKAFRQIFSFKPNKKQAELTKCDQIKREHSASTWIESANKFRTIWRRLSILPETLYQFQHDAIAFKIGFLDLICLFRTLFARNFIQFVFFFVQAETARFCIQASNAHKIDPITFIVSPLIC